MEKACLSVGFAKEKTLAEMKSNVTEKFHMLVNNLKEKLQLGNQSAKPDEPTPVAYPAAESNVAAKHLEQTKHFFDKY